MAEHTDAAASRPGGGAVPERAPPADVVAGAQVRPGDPGHAAYPLSEGEYWLAAHAGEPYWDPSRSFADYSTAYELGWVSYHLYGGEFDTAERVLANEWLVRKGISQLSWEQARPAARASWQRAESAKFVTDGTAAAEDVRATLEGLFESARDAQLGFREAAAHAGSPELVALFEELARQCDAAAVQWQGRIEQLGGTVAEGGTVAGAAQRVWLQIRGLFGGASNATLLAECERGADEVVDRLRGALQRNLPADLHAAVQREYQQSQRQHDHLRRLRDQAAAAAPGEREQPA